MTVGLDLLKDSDYPRTLQDVARNTRQSSHAWTTDAKLRKSAVKFVSSGSYAGEDLLDNVENGGALEVSNKKLEESQASFSGLKIQDTVQDDLMRLERPAKISFAQEPPLSGIDTRELETSFAIDLVGDVSFKAEETPAHRPSSPTPSNSSEEVVLFKGRKQTRGDEPPVSKNSMNGDIDKDSDLNHHQSLPKSSEHLSKNNSPTSHTPQPVSYQTIEPELHRGNRNLEAADIGILEDYVANLKASGELDDMIQNGLIPSRELDVHLTTHSLTASPNRLDTETKWTRSDLQDFDDLGTSFTCLESIHVILSKRQRPSGVQYLVVWEGYTVDDARWIPRTSLNMPDAENFIAIFEAQEKQIPEFAESESISGEESEGLEIPDDLIESDEDMDDKDLWQRRANRLTDEKIAWLLAKQEELGLGSETLKILDDSAEDIELPTKSKKVNKKSLVSNGKKPRDRKKGKQSMLDFDLDGMADQSDDLKVVEFESTRLRSKPGTFDTSAFAGISDSDLEMQMRSTWMKGRDKKRIKKQEREQLRAQGLLGSKNGKPDLKAKYPDTMSPQQVINEILDFFDSDAQS
jgi:hypothetical protein